jgi:hypothetical protein
MAKPPLPIIPLPKEWPEGWELFWNNLLWVWQYAVATEAAKIQCRAFNSAAQTIANVTTTALTFDTDDFDVGSIHSTTVNTSQFTAPTGQNGLYLAIGTVSYVSNVAGRRVMFIRKNGTTNYGIANTMAITDAAAASAINAAAVLTMVGGDYVEFTTVQASGGNLNTIAGNNATFGELIRLR